MNKHKSWNTTTEGAKARLRKVQAMESEKKIDSNKSNHMIQNTTNNEVYNFVPETNNNNKKIEKREKYYEQQQQIPTVRKNRSRSGSNFGVVGAPASGRQEVDFLYERPPEPEPRERPEDVIPDLPQNAEARDFLRKAPTKGLWMPLGKEVKVMKCWRCGAYGHRRDDRDCPLFLSGTEQNENFLKRHEDPMSEYLTKQATEKDGVLERIEYYKSILEKVEKKEKKKHKHKDKNKGKEKKRKRSSCESESLYKKRKK